LQPLREPASAFRSGIAIAVGTADLLAPRRSAFTSSEADLSNLPWLFLRAIMPFGGSAAGASSFLRFFLVFAHLDFVSFKSPLRLVLCCTAQGTSAGSNSEQHGRFPGFLRKHGF
jgi:hypothetical protein